jgi:putative hydroxymethylpyrimidine transport system substrate-binding protein
MLRSSRLPVLAALAVLALAAGCGEKSESMSGKSRQKIDLALDWFPNPDHIGIYQALDAGYFADAGLELRPRIPSDPSAPIKQVAAGRVDLAISYEPEVFLARQQGLDVVAVAALVPRPLTSLIWLPRKRIRFVRDLKGRRVATAGIPYQTGYLRTVLEHAGLRKGDVRQVDVGANLLPALLSGRVDAILGGFRNVEGVELQLRRKRPRVVTVDRLGVPAYDELVLVAQGERVKSDPDPIRRFIAALARGTSAAMRSPREAVRALLRANEDLDPRITRASVRATLPLLRPVRRGRPFGFLDARRWVSYGGWMVDQGLLRVTQPVSELLNDELLPGQGL